jgi:hypothetical protein
MTFNYIIEEWTISKLLNHLEDGKFVKLPHQRPLTLKRNSSKRFIESALNNDLLELFIFADLETSLLASTTDDDKEFFDSYLKRGKVYSIEDCQHRMASLESITDEDFVNEYENRKEDFLNTKIYVGLIQYANRSELIRKFGKVNSGKTVTNDNLLWGIDNMFNNFIKNKFIDDDKIIRLYNIKKKSESVERTIYGNVLKIIKVCGYHDGIVSSSNTNTDSMMTFVKSNHNINELNNLFELFDLWYDHIKIIPTKESFTSQSNLFFILHILNNKNIKLNNDNVNSIFSLLTDTRSSPEKRYNHILNIIENYGFTRTSN